MSNAKQPWSIKTKFIIYKESEEDDDSVDLQVCEPLTNTRKQSWIQSWLKEPNREDICIICLDEDPPGKSRKVDWIDCDLCKEWSHLKCPKMH